jgi:hypothetical protein
MFTISDVKPKHIFGSLHNETETTLWPTPIWSSGMGKKQLNSKYKDTRNNICESFQTPGDTLSLTSKTNKLFSHHKSQQQKVEKLKHNIL